MSRRSLLLIAAVVIAALGTALIVLYVRGIDARAAAGQELVEVLVAGERIDLGETAASAIAAGKFERVEVVRKDRVADALVSTESIEDQRALATIYPGEQILPQRFGNPGDEEKLIVPEGLIAVAVEVTDAGRVANLLTAGSDVAMFATADLERIVGKERFPLGSYTRIIVPRVEVLAVGETTVISRKTTDDQGQSTTEEVPRTIITVALTQDQAEKVIFASNRSEVTFALLNDTSQTENNPGADAGDVIPEPFAPYGGAVAR